MPVWTLRDEMITSALIGTSRPGQIAENVHALENLYFTPGDPASIDSILAG